MSELNLQQNSSIVNEIHFNFNGEIPMVSSREVALRFQKRHHHVLRDIERLNSILPKSFTATNFGLSKCKDRSGKEIKEYFLTRDAFSLLVMGFTGKLAIQWKLKYIEAFNLLEKEITQTQLQQAYDLAYQQGIDYASSSPALEAREAKAHLAGFNEGVRMQSKKDGLVRMENLMRYDKMGLSNLEIQKIFGISKNSLVNLKKKARKLGLLPPSPFTNKRFLQGA